MILSISTFLAGQLYRYVSKVNFVEKRDMPLDEMLRMRATMRSNEYTKAGAYAFSIIGLIVVLYDLIFG